MEERTDRFVPGLLVLLTVGIVVGGLLVGIEPVGGDPDRMYRPIKSELARSLRDFRLPFWSDRFGLGLPLAAESHVAAFYPPNWLLYRALDTPTAYRLSMWLHYIALAAATYAYARRLGLLPWGSALAALAFTLCGFQTIHSSHEPLYSALPFMVLALYFTEDFIDRGRVASLAFLALTWGAQLTLGHFQTQTLTAGLVIATGLWRSVQTGAGQRALGLVAGLGAGAGIAAVQLALSWDLATFVGSTNRSAEDLMFFSYPPAHWAELVIPRLFAGLPGGPEHAYWFTQGTTGYEACLYVGTIPLVLACLGLTVRDDRALAPWRPRDRQLRAGDDAALVAGRVSSTPGGSWLRDLSCARTLYGDHESRPRFARGQRLRSHPHRASVRARLVSGRGVGCDGVRLGAPLVTVA